MPRKNATAVAEPDQPGTVAPTTTKRKTRNPAAIAAVTPIPVQPDEELDDVFPDETDDLLDEPETEQTDSDDEFGDVPQPVHVPRPQSQSKRGKKGQQPAQTEPEPEPVAAPTTAKSKSKSRKKAAAAEAEADTSDRPAACCIVNQAELKFAASVIGCFNSKGAASDLWKTVTLVEFDAANGTVAISRSSGNVQIAYRISGKEFQGDANARFGITSKRLLNLALGLPDEELLLEVTASTLDVTTSTGSYSVTTVDIENMPEMPEIALDPSLAMSLPSELLEKIVVGIRSAVAPTTSTHEVLKTIVIEAPDGTGKLHFNACDGHRLNRYTVDAPAGVAPFPQIAIPIEAVNQLVTALKLVNPETVLLQVDHDAGTVTAEFGDVQLQASCLTESIPNFKQLIDQAVAAQRHDLLVERSAIKTFLKRLDTLLGDDKEKVLRLTTAAADENLLRLAVESKDGISGTEKLPADYPGALADFAMAANLRYLSQAITSIPTRIVCLKLESSTKPILVLPTMDEDLTDPPDLVALLMPIQIRDNSAQ